MDNPENVPTAVVTTVIPAPAPVAVECPHCHHKFLHKIGHALEKVAEGAVEIALSGTGAIGGQ
jgi:hypothetical protein